MMKGQGGGELYEGGPKSPHVPGKSGDQSIAYHMKAQPMLSETPMGMAKGIKRALPMGPGDSEALASVNATKPGYKHM